MRTTKGALRRLRVEHPSSFTARFMAALLDREIHGRTREALNSLFDLKSIARAHGHEAIEQLCQGLFETASAVDRVALAKARSVVDALLGDSNRYRLYFDTVAFLFEDRLDAALAELNAHKRHDDAVWWQLVAKAHELAGDLDKASECWDRAAQLMPHPDILTRFAGLSIQQNKFKDAVRALKAATTRSPDNPKILEQLAFAHTRLREFSEAGLIFETIGRLQPDVERHKVNLALCQAQSGDPKSALNSIDKVVDFSHPDFQIIGLRTNILNSLGRTEEAFADLQRLKTEFWDDLHFLVLYMDTAYRAGEDKAAHSAFQQLMVMQHKGQLSEPIFHSVSLDDLKQMGTERLRQREHLFSEVVRGKFPWLEAEALLGTVADQAWHRRTQRLTWLVDDVPARGEWTVYATNGISVHRGPDGNMSLSHIGVPLSSEPVVADMSALITLHRLDRLTTAATFFGKLILPASYGNLPVHDARKLIPHQPSREQELQIIQDVVQRQLITIIDDAEEIDHIPLVDEHRDGGDQFALADVAQMLQATQRITSQERDEFRSVCHRPMRENRELPTNSPVLIAASTLRTMARYGWFERILPTLKWCVKRPDYEDELRELREFEFQRTIYNSHLGLWQEINDLRASGSIEFRDSPSCRRREVESQDVEADSPPYLDAMLLANDVGLRLLADDRVCQAAVLNQHPDRLDAAFGTDRFLAAMEDKGALTSEEVYSDVIQLMRWRYRFLLLESHHLKIAALRSCDNLPGPELREIAAYVQESMRDPGLFCGPEKADPPTPVAVKYFMAWNEVCGKFLAAIWNDPEFNRDQLEIVTRWCIESLLPAVPRGLIYSPVGRRLASISRNAFLLTLMIWFVPVQPLERANEALRLMADHLGIGEDEFHEVAAEAADHKYH